MKFYELSQAYRTLADRLEEETQAAEGEVTPEVDLIKSALDSIDDAIDRKAECSIVLAREFEAEAAAIKVEEARLAKRRKALENRADRVREYVLGCLRSAGKDRLRTQLFSFTVNKPKPSVVVLDVNAIPDDLVRIIPASREAAKKEIKDAIAAGRAVPGVKLEDGDYSLTVR